MIIKYNSLNRVEQPVFTLCNPGCTYQNGHLSNAVGNIPDHEAEELILNFNSISELNMRVNYALRDSDYDNRHIEAIYKAVQNRRLIFIENIGFFMIKTVEEGYEGNKKFKDITAQSIDCELQNKLLPFIADGTYRFYNPGSPISPIGTVADVPPASTRVEEDMLTKIVSTLPLWTIGHVDDAVSLRWRTFEDVDTQLDCLSFFINNIQEAYECIVIFDNINRTINVYDMESYIHQTSIHITREDVVNSINITENADDLYTALSVKSDENNTIAAINPLGTSVIYKFDYYKDWMSQGLQDRLTLWEAAIEDSREEYYDASLAYFETRGLVINMQLEIARLNLLMSLYQRCRDNIVAESNTDFVSAYNAAIRDNGGGDEDLVPIYPEIEQTLAALDDLIAACQLEIDADNEVLDGYNEELAEYESTLAGIRESLNMENYFGVYYDELINYIFEGSYVDEYVVITDVMTYPEKFEQLRILYNRAVERLNKVSTPTQEFNIDTENFLFVKEFSEWTAELETGCLINVEIETNDIASLFLTSINLNYDDRQLTLTFGNRYNRFDPRALFENTLGQISKSANTLNYIKDVVTPITDGTLNDMQKALQNSRNITMDAALSSSGEEVIIDGSGYTGRRMLDTGVYDPRQVKITGKNLVFTDDSWQTCQVALGEIVLGDDDTVYGINAQSIIGDLILGSSLRITDGTNDLFSIVDNQIASSVRDLDGRITQIEQTANGLVIRVQSLEGQEVDHVVTSTGFVFDENGLLIQKAGSEMCNQLTENGMYVSRSETEVLTANNIGVNAINLTARQYLHIGENSRFEDYSNGVDTKRTACFIVA